MSTSDFNSGYRTPTNSPPRSAFNNSMDVRAPRKLLKALIHQPLATEGMSSDAEGPRADLDDAAKHLSFEREDIDNEEEEEAEGLKSESPVGSTLQSSAPCTPKDQPIRRPAEPSTVEMRENPLAFTSVDGRPAKPLAFPESPVHRSKDEANGTDPSCAQTLSAPAEEGVATTQVQNGAAAAAKKTASYKRIGHLDNKPSAPRKRATKVVNKEGQGSPEFGTKRAKTDDGIVSGEPPPP